MLKALNLKESFARIPRPWQPHIAAAVNDCYVKLVKLEGEFIWHSHADEDELFYVVRGRLLMKLRGGERWVEEGEFIVIPRGTEHCPCAPEEVWVMLIEPKSTVREGDKATTTEAEQPWIVSSPEDGNPLDCDYDLPDMDTEEWKEALEYQAGIKKRYAAVLDIATPSLHEVQSDFNENDFHEIDTYCGQTGIARVLWLDYLVPLRSRSDMFKAFDCTLGTYFDFRESFDVLRDYLFDRYYLPKFGVIFYIHDVSPLQQADPDTCAVLLRILSEVGERMKASGYHYKSLVRYGAGPAE